MYTVWSVKFFALETNQETHQELNQQPNQGTRQETNQDTNNRVKNIDILFIAFLQLQHDLVWSECP